MLPPEDRLVGAQLHRYIGDKLYGATRPQADGKNLVSAKLVTGDKLRQ